jgi:3-hydroxyisobutyrate dehydrogenase
MLAAMTHSTVALLGLGIMGSRMGRRLLDAGFPLTVYNRTADRARPLGEAGARIVRTPAEALAGADIAIGMVSDDEASRRVWLGEEGALAAAAPGTLIIESSTLSVAWTRELATAAADRRCDFLDAPVTGSRHQAGAGELNFLVGGDAGTLERARPVLRVMARSITHLGPTGSGALVKLINNFVCGTQVASLAEALATVERSGLDRERTMQVLINGAMGSPIVKTVAERMLGSDFTPNFMVRLLAKDLRYAIREGGALGVDLTTAKNALALLDRSIAAGCGEDDMAAAIVPLRAK